MFHGEGMAAVEGFDRLLPAAGDEDIRAALCRRLPDPAEIE